jgi:GNAT superfamily N-acetyltransferase
MIIRKYRDFDRSSVEHIQFETYFLGKSGKFIADNEKRFNKDIQYYLDNEQESCFVAEDKGQVVGYLLGCLDDKKHPLSILKLYLQYSILIIQLPFMSSKDRRFWWSRIKFLFSALFKISKDAEFKTPKGAGHLHINLLPEARGFGVGTKLLKEFFKYAKSKGVKTVHADSWQTRLNPNKNFWIKNGFKEYDKIQSSFWKEYHPKEKIYVVCYTRNL